MTTVRANSFLLSMASPVLHKMISGSFTVSTTRQLPLQEVDGKAFEEVMKLWCGKEGRAEQLDDVMEMASVAYRLEILDVFALLEASIIGELRPELCAEALISSRRLGLSQVEAAAWTIAVEQFDEVCRTAGFMVLDEETVGKLLEEDGLGVVKEEEAFEGLVGWMKSDDIRSWQGRELLRLIRFGVMEERYLEEKARGMVPEEHREWMEGLVGEALRAKAAVRTKPTVEVGQLGAKALTRRRGRGVDWGRYCDGGGGRRLQGHSGEVLALAECQGRMCSGSADGSIRVWRLDTLEEERVLLSEGYESEEHDDVSEGDESEEHNDVNALAVWEGQLISGHGSGRVRVWDVNTGERRRELVGHSGGVWSLCAVGSRLASGYDGLIKVWAMRPDPEWSCERTLTGHTRLVASLAEWEGKLISGSWDSTIRVWELETGELHATVTGHRGPVCALLVQRERLFSTSADGSIRTWAVGTWVAVVSVEAYDVRASQQHPRCLVASGSKLISGSGGTGSGIQCELRVWDFDSLTCEHTVRLPAGADVRCLAAAGGRVWGGVGREVVAWGWE